MKADAILDFMEFIETLRAEPERLDDGSLLPEFVEIIKPLVVKVETKTQSIGDLESEILQLNSELNQFKPTFGITEEDREQQQQYIKLKASLINKLVDLKERTMNLRAMKSFQDKVLLAVDKIMTAEQRTAFMEELEK